VTYTHSDDVLSVAQESERFDLPVGRSARRRLECLWRVRVAGELLDE
jgi:hypothetical protein